MTSDAEKFKNQDTFYKFEDRIGFNWAVTMFMVDAMKHFKDMTKTDVMLIAFEMALIGINGINPDGEHKYKAKLIPDKEFSGFHFLAYEYVAWAIAIPEELDNLLLPYSKEYEQAQKIFNSKLF